MKRFMTSLHRARSPFLSMVAAVLVSSTAFAQLNFEAAPVSYETAPTANPVAELQDRIASGKVTLEYNEHYGYLPAVLEHLNVPVSSQMLVFSKTSFQLRKITPDRPRAVYFNDDVYVGWVQRGDVVEISTADRELGAVFYTLSQDEPQSPRFVRDRGQCLSCHASSRTAGVPGHLVRSVFTDRTGQPFFGSGTFTTDHSSPFEQRWGGWYVSGTHGGLRHMGNVTIDKSDDPEDFDREQGANVADLTSLVDVSQYLAPTSDIVALMVLEHQTQMQNLITRASFETRSALHNDDIMNKAMERPADYRSESATRRIEAVCERLVEYMLFAEEFALTSPVSGTSDFAAEFAARGPFDSQGRSLRQFDLQTRLMKYPCSYLIYSAPFDALPDATKADVYRRLYDVLTGTNRDPEFSHLTQPTRTAILEILRETKPDLPDYWRPEG